jgi:hypothetical protein
MIPCERPQLYSMPHSLPLQIPHQICQASVVVLGLKIGDAPLNVLLD